MNTQSSILMRATIKGILLVTLLSFSYTSHAEYYFAYPHTCCEVSTTTHYKHHYFKRHHKHHKKIAKTTHRPYHHKKHHYYSHHCCPVQSCGYRCCHHAYYESHRYRSRTHFYTADSYNPDMSTGDDNALFYPDMNIDE